MAPLDTGPVTPLRLVEPLGRPSGPTAEAYSTLGAYLQAVREHRGDTLPDLADTTRIRISHLKAIEADEFDVLPSRPFAIGYVRAYANALRLDGEAAVARFKREVADEGPVLKAPVGVAHEGDARRPVMYALGGAALAAVVLWNIAQRTMHAEDPTPSGLAPAVAASDPVEANGLIRVSAPTQASAEQGAPTPYVTPGIDPDDPATPSVAAAGVLVPSKSAAAKVPTGALVTPATQPASLELHGAVYGAASGQALLVARQASALIIRGGGGAIVFARELEPGQAYRLPVGQSLIAEASDPQALDLYVGGQLRGALTAVQTPIDRLAEAQPATLKGPTAKPATPAAPKPSVKPAASASTPTGAPAQVQKP